MISEFINVFSKYYELTMSVFVFTLAVKKEEEDFEEKKSIKKRIKELKVLDPKIAQNLCKQVLFL